MPQWSGLVIACIRVACRFIPIAFTLQCPRIRCIGFGGTGRKPIVAEVTGWIPILRLI